MTGHRFPYQDLSGGYKTYATATAPIENKTATIRTNGKTDTQHTGEQIKTLKIDACGLQYPGPVMKIKQAIDSIGEGERIEMVATDTRLSRRAGMVQHDRKHPDIRFGRKGQIYGRHSKRFAPSMQDGHLVRRQSQNAHHVQPDDLDKALATFVLANGAAATGQKVSIFFTFWGLNVIKKVAKPKVKKDIFGRMFGMMLPWQLHLKLHLSKIGMLGIGNRMMRHIMKRKGIDSLESLRQQAIDSGVEFIACQMSMDVMGVKREELLDESDRRRRCDLHERAEGANVNLFVKPTYAMKKRNFSRSRGGDLQSSVSGRKSERDTEEHAHPRNGAGASSLGAAYGIEHKEWAHGDPTRTGFRTLAPHSRWARGRRKSDLHSRRGASSGRSAQERDFRY